MNESITEALISAIQAHGLTVCRDGDVLLVNEGHLVLQTAVFETRQSARATVVLELQAASPLLAGRSIIECFAGVGDSVEHATQDAFGKMLSGSFHVLIEAFADHACDHSQVDIEQWKGERSTWQAFLGPLVTQHASASTLAGTYSQLLSDLQALFVRTAPAGHHWIRVFVGAYQGEVRASEVLLDNEPWDAGLAMLQARPWQCTEEYQSVRHFILVLQARSSDTPSPSHDPPAHGLKKLLARTLGRMRSP